MNGSEDERLPIAADTSVLLNFLKVERFDLVCRHPDYRMVVTEHVRSEVEDPAQSACLEAAITADEIGLVAVTDPADLKLFAELNAVLGRGESATIAIAVHHRWAVATDDRRAQREVLHRLGSGWLLTTPGILLNCIRNGALTVDEADSIKGTLETFRFAMKFDSFRELLP